MFERYKMTPCASVCPKHGEQMYTIGPQAVEVCLSCGREDIEKAEQKTQDDYHDQQEKLKEKLRLDMLYNFSLVNAELRNATLGNYRIADQDQRQKLDIAVRLVDEYINGASNNVLFLGPAGVGKSHLAYGMIKAISDKTKKHALFIKVPELMARIKADFKSQKNTEQDWIAKLSKVPFLVLDDLGTETVTDWSKSVLFSILDNRSRTIITSNLGSSGEIEKVYGIAITDRICKGVDKNHGFKFDGMKSQRRNYF